jgi:hypothetical protein
MAAKESCAASAADVADVALRRDGAPCQLAARVPVFRIAQMCPYHQDPDMAAVITVDHQAQPLDED